SNGKSTTVNMLSFALKKLKIPHFMGGNWGLPYAEILLDPQYQNAKFAVLELSSFQLELVEDFAPLVACLLNITPNHMERYSNFKEYKEAKYKIATHAQYFFDCVDLEEFEQKFDLSKAKVKGKHNVSNFAFCYRALKAAGINCDDLFQKVIEDFPGIPHRLEYAGTYQGVRYYNDSKSTNVEATITALEAFPLKEKVHLILGGKNRSEDISEFKELLKFKNIESYRFFGQAASKLEKCFENNENIFKYHDLAQVMKDLKPKVGEIILFSPGFPSYDQYQNFNERGEHFKSLLASKKADQ
ncbi:MAG: hypothetical protein H6620_11195, partial [Halobacteriovoraceae bacterium]|nr:hypothetical protein [Halobacteriovoraceae bacterium]